MFLVMISVLADEAISYERLKYIELTSLLTRILANFRLLSLSLNAEPTVLSRDKGKVAVMDIT